MNIIDSINLLKGENKNYKNTKKNDSENVIKDVMGNVFDEMKHKNLKKPAEDTSKSLLEKNKIVFLEKQKSQETESVQEQEQEDSLDLEDESDQEFLSWEEDDFDDSDYEVVVTKIEDAEFCDIDSDPIQNSIVSDSNTKLSSVTSTMTSACSWFFEKAKECAQTCKENPVMAGAATVTGIAVAVSSLPVVVGTCLFGAAFATGAAQSAASLGGAALAGNELARLTELIEKQDWSKDDQEKLALVDPEGQLDSLLESIIEKVMPSIFNNLDKNCESFSIYTFNKQKIDAFLKLYISKIFKSILGHIAVTHGEIPETQKQVLFANIAKGLFSIVNQNMKKSDLAAIHELQNRYKEAPEDEKPEIQNELRAYVKPLTLTLLQNSGINSIEDFHLGGLWSTWGLSKLFSFFYNHEEIISDIILDKIKDFNFTSFVSDSEINCLSTFQGHDKLESLVNVTVDKSVDTFRSSLKTNKAKLAEVVVRALAANKILDPSYASVEELLNYLSSENAEVCGFWTLIKDMCSPRMLNLLQVAVQNDLPGMDSVDNIFERLFLVLTKTVKTTLENKNEILEAKVMAYDKLAILIKLLEDAERYFVDHKKTIEETLSSLNLENRDSIEEFMDFHITAILNPLSEKERATIASIARNHFGSNLTGQDIHVFRKVFFEWEQDSSSLVFSASNKTLRESLQKIKELQARNLGGTFGGLEEALLKALGLDTEEKWNLLNLPSLVSYNFVKTQILPPLLLEVYRDVKLSSDGKAASLDLSLLLFDNHNNNQQEVLRDILQRGDSINSRDKDFLKEHNIDSAKELIEGGLEVVAKDLKNIVWQTLSSEEKIGEAIRPMLCEMSAIDEETAEILIKAIKGAASSEDPSVTALFNFLQNSISTVLLKILVNVGKNLESEDSTQSNKYFIARALLEIFKKLNAHKESIAAGMHIHKEPGTQEFKDVFKPVVKDIMALAHLDPLQDLPGVFGVKENLWNLLQQSILPEFFGQMYVSTTEWQSQENKVEKEKTLHRIYGTNYPKESVNALAGFSAESIQSYLSINSGDLSETLYDKLYSYLQQSERPDLVENLQKNSKNIKKVVGDNIASTVQPSETIISTLDSIREYLHSILLTAFSNFSENIDVIDKKEDAHFLQKTAFKVLKRFYNHVKKINEVSNREGKTDVRDVNPAVMLKAFLDSSAESKAERKGRLPNLVKLSEYQDAKKRLQAAKKNLDNQLLMASVWTNKDKLNQSRQEFDEATKSFAAIRQEKFFKPLAKKLLNLAKLGKNKFPAFPDPLKEKLWDLCESNLIPTMLDNLFQSLMHPQKINSLMLAAINAIDDTLKKIPEQESPEAPVEVKNTSSISEEDVNNDRLCGHLVSELLSLLPTIMSKTIFDMDLVRSTAEPVLGAAVRNTFDQATMIQLLNLVLEKGIPSLLQGTEWKLENGAKPGEETLAFTAIDGGRSGASRRSFGLPLTAEQRNLEQEKLKNIEDKMPSELKKMMVKTLSTQLQSLVSKTLNELLSPWRAFRSSFEKKVKEYFGQHSERAVKKFLNDVASIFKLMLDYSFGVLFNVFWIFFMEKWYLGQKANQIIESFHMEINEHFLFDVVGTFVEALEKELDVDLDVETA